LGRTKESTQTEEKEEDMIPKHMNDYELLVVRNLLYEEDAIIPFSNLNIISYVTPENILIKKEGYRKLSDEAKEVIQTILYAPAEVLSLIESKRRGVSKTLAMKYFHKNKGWKKLKVDRVFSEVKIYVRGI
jgi:hypothetical protein